MSPEPRCLPTRFRYSSRLPRMYAFISGDSKCPSVHHSDCAPSRRRTPMRRKLFSMTAPSPDVSAQICDERPHTYSVKRVYSSTSCSTFLAKRSNGKDVIGQVSSIGSSSQVLHEVRQTAPR